MLRLIILCLLSSGCAALAQLPTGAAVPRPVPPTAIVSAATLVSAPTEMQLIGHYCPRFAPSLVCRQLAPAPPADALQFLFDVHVDLHNPNGFPLPAVEALAMFTAFPDVQEQTLGAVCISLCEDPAQCPQQTANACRGGGGGPEVRTMDQAVNATARFLYAVATGQAALENLRIETIPAGGDARLTFRLALDPTTVLALLQTLAADAIADVRGGREPSFVIPFEVEGTVWVEVESWGRIAASVPPFRGSWTL